jgi:hypothetical protein
MTHQMEDCVGEPLFVLWIDGDTCARLCHELRNRRHGARNGHGTVCHSLPQNLGKSLTPTRVKHEVSASQYLGDSAAGHGSAKTNDILQTMLLRQILESRSEGPVANDFQENFRRPLAQALGHPDGGIGAFASGQVAHED